jgi:hypothetical protein
MKKIRLYLGTAVISALIIYFVVFMIGVIKNLQSESITFISEIPSEYLELFTKDMQKKISYKKTYDFKNRADLSFIVYDQKFDIDVTKLNTGNLSLDKNLILSNQEPEGKSIYNLEFKKEGFKMYYADYNDEKGSNLYFSLNGNSIKTVVRNDSLAGFDLKLAKMYLQYKKNGIFQLYGLDNNSLFKSDKNLLTEIMFYQKT